MREIDLEIAGQRLHVRTDEDEQYMRQLAAYVDSCMREVGKAKFALEGTPLRIELRSGRNPYVRSDVKG